MPWSLKVLFELDVEDPPPPPMSIHIFHSGANRTMQAGYVFVSGANRPIKEIWIYHAGANRLVYSSSS